ncbi:uncharacterized protein LOC122926266 [Bufo gargarizans]|uniref:uncharacterized protein LOC122926266 n=1 Tax=Bufo gargarizans TaxID=30331 RepID=UPI001CF53F61|nr:uncharacterized protein LOC122926266 [Bufo gargarizans]
MYRRQKRQRALTEAARKPGIQRTGLASSTHLVNGTFKRSAHFDVFVPIPTNFRVVWIFGEIGHVTVVTEISDGEAPMYNPHYRGRSQMFDNGTLRLDNVAYADAGHYSLYVYDDDTFSTNIVPYDLKVFVKKPDGSYRTIINLKKRNHVLLEKKFRMETINSTINLLFPGCFMAVLNLKDAYHHVPIHQDYQKYLRFTVQTEGVLKHWQFLALPFGLAVAPRVFTKVIAEMSAHIREKDILFIPYLDDFLIVAETEKACELAVLEVIRILKKLGWILNDKKSRPRPIQRQQFLGLILDFRHQKCFLTEKKIACIQQKIQNLIVHPRITLRKATLQAPSLSIVSDLIVHGTNLTLHCDVGNQTVTTYTFYRGQKMICSEPHVTCRGSFLELTPKSKDDSGSYTCHIENPVSSNTSHPIPVTVSVPVSAVTLTTNTSDRFLWPGRDSVSLRCSSNGTDVRYSWTLDGAPLPQDPRYQLTLNSSTLIISPVSATDNGYFMCTAKNSTNEENSTRLYLNLAGSPEAASLEYKEYTHPTRIVRVQQNQTLLIKIWQLVDISYADDQHPVDDILDKQ